MVAWNRCAKALRASAAALGLCLARMAAAFVQIPRVALNAMGAAMPVAAGTIVLAGGVSVGYQLLHGADGHGRSVVLSRHARHGQLLRQVVDVGGPHGENNPLLASAEGLPAPGSVQPLAGVSGPIAHRTPSASAAGMSPPRFTSADTNYLQAAALATMVELDVPPHVEAGWPVVSYCRAGVHALQCHHDDLWLRNRWTQALSHADVCVAPSQAGYFRLAGADAQGCVAVHFPRRGDAHVVVREVMPAQADFPSFHDLDLQLKSPVWWGDQVLHDLWVPIVGPQTFFPIRYPSFRDEAHEFGVQQRPVDLLTRLVVFTYHGSGESAARVSTLKLEDPEQGFRLLSSSRNRAIFEQYHVPACTSAKLQTPHRVHLLYSGMSCGLLVSATDLRRAPYATPLLPSHFNARPLGASAPKTQFSMADMLRTHGDGWQPDVGTVRGSLYAVFLLRGGAQDGVEVGKMVPLLSEQLVVAAGDFTRAGTLGNMYHPMPHVAIIGPGGISAPKGLLLNEQHNMVDVVSPSPGGGHLYVGGSFSPQVPMPSAATSSALAAWDGQAWSYWNRGNGPDGQVLALSPDQGKLYVGGDFVHVAGQLSPGIVALAQARDGAQSWQPLGQGLVFTMPGKIYRRAGPGVIQGRGSTGVVRAIMPLSGGRLLVGGIFGTSFNGLDPTTLRTTSGAYSNLALWDPARQTWEGGNLLSGGADPGKYGSMVRALAGFEGRVYVGGSFEWAAAAADGALQVAPGLGWVGLHVTRPPYWRAVSELLRSHVSALATTVGGLYAAGDFYDRQHLLRAVLLYWDGTDLQGLDKPLLVRPRPSHGQAVHLDALLSLGKDLYLGGEFSDLVGGGQAANIAVYDSQDQRVGAVDGQGFNGRVLSLTKIWRLRAGSH